MDSREVLQLFEKSGALLRGHFKLTSGRHSDVYYEKFSLLKNPEICTSICADIASHFKDKKIAKVVGPTLGGVIIAYEVARYLGVEAVYAEQGEISGRVLKRDFSLEANERVLIVDDVLTTGRSVHEVIDLVRKYDCEIVGIGIVLDRSGGQTKFDYPQYAVSTINAESWDESECPMCKKEIELTKRGSRKGK